MTEALGSSDTSVAAQTPVRTAQPARWRGRVAIVAVLVGFGVGQGAALAIIQAADGDDASDAVAALALAAGDLIALAVVLVVARRGADRLGPATLGLRRTRFWPAVGWMLAIYFGVIAAEGFWAIVVGGAPSTRGGDMPHPATVTALVALLAMAVIAPIVEEIAFRGYLFPALTRWRGPWIGALITALLFGAAHVGVYPIEFLPALAAFGFGACMLFWFTGSLLPCIALHALNNGLVVAAGFHWSWQVPLAALGAVALTQVLLLPLARERTPQAK